jgi:hypothetical protein
MTTVACRNRHISLENGWFRAIRPSALVILLGILCLLLPAKSVAQSSNRWLFVFNTSASMRDRSNGVAMVAADLLTTAMHGVIRPGDTIGIWTYNNALHADEAPLQTWFPNTAPAIAQNTIQFLSQHSYEKSAVFDDVLANMLRVIKISDVVTVILVSDGADSFKGTSFDAQLTTFYKTNHQAQKKARQPIVTVFRGEKGSITTNTVALAPWPADIPAVPPLPVVVPAVVQKPAPAPAPKPVPSLVIIGKKAETTFNPPSDLPDHVDQVTLPAEVESAPAVIKAEVPPPAPEPAAKVEEKPAPAVVPVVAAPAPAPVVAAEPPKAVPAPELTVAAVAAPEPMVAPVPATNLPANTAVAPPPAPVQTVAAASGNNLLSGGNIAIVSVAFTVLVCGLLLVSARNARNASRASLITRSLDREAK